VVHERTGNTSEFVFTNFRTDLKADSGQFQFKIPKGVEVVRLDEK
jgi:outer membrane lipoprotein-sorting protein